MADTAVSNFTPITGANVASGDLWPLIDISATGSAKNAAMTSVHAAAAIAANLAAGAIAASAVAGTAAVLGANTFTGAQVYSSAVAASTPVNYFTGALLGAGGNGTTTFPLCFHQPTGATAATDWSNGANGGTIFGANEATGFTGNFAHFKTAGVDKALIDSTGALCVGTGGNGSGYLVKTASSAGTSVTGVYYSSNNLYLYGNTSVMALIQSGGGSGGGVFAVPQSSSGSTQGAAIGFKAASYLSAQAQLVQEAANHISQFNGTTAQIHTIANTWTSTTNFERFKIDWSATANTCRIGTSKGGGGGSARALHLEVGDSAAIKISTAGAIDFAMLATTTETITPDKTITVSIAGVAVKIPCL